MRGKKAGITEDVPGAKDPETAQLLKTFDSRLQRSRTAFANWREKCRRWYRFYSNDAWDPADRSALESEGRIPVTFNYALSTVNTIIGSDMADRKEGRFWGVDGHIFDEVRGEWLTTLSRHIYRAAKGHRHESQAQLDQLITGYGWAEVFVDSTRFPFRIRPSYVDCQQMHLDPDYREDNATDARYLICESKWHREDALANWPGKEAELKTLSATFGPSGMFPKQVERGRHYHVSIPDDHYREPEDERVVIFDYQFKKREPWVAFRDPETGLQQQLSAADFEKRKKELFDQVDEATGDSLYPDIPEAVRFAREVVYRAYLAGNESGASVLLEEPKRIKQDLFTYRCATGFRERDTETGRTRHFGLMAVIEEPQRWSAKVLSMILEMMARNSKGGGFIKPSALVDENKFAADSSKPGAWHFLKDDAVVGDDILERPPMQWPQGFEKLLDLAVNAIPELSAVTNWLKGTAQTERSNVLISNLQGQSMIVLGPLLDPMSQFRVELHTLCIRLAQEYLSAEDINKIIGEQEIDGVTHRAGEDPETGEPSLQPIMIDDPATGEQRPITPADILREADILEFHVAVDLGAASTTAKQALWQLFNQTGLLQKLVEVGFPMQELFPWLIRNMPGIPAETSKEIAGKIQQQMQAAEQQQTFEGIAEAVQGLPPEQQSELAAMLQQAQPAAAAPAA